MAARISSSSGVGMGGGACAAAASCTSTVSARAPDANKLGATWPRIRSRRASPCSGLPSPHSTYISFSTASDLTPRSRSRWVRAKPSSGRVSGQTRGVEPGPPGSVEPRDGRGAGPRQGADQAVRRFRGRRRDRLPGRAGRGVRLPRPERCGQDLDDADDLVRVARDRWRATGARARPRDGRLRDPWPARRGAPGGHARPRAHRAGEPADLRAVLRPRRDP